MLWHADDTVRGVDAVVVPGGFAHGDYLRTGAIARFSPVMDAVAEFAAGGGPVVGICNGFQVLTEAGLLPGALQKNVGLSFLCETVELRVETTASVLTARRESGAVLRVPINHFEGNYVCDDDDAAATARRRPRRAALRRQSQRQPRRHRRHRQRGGQRRRSDAASRAGAATLLGSDDGVVLLRVAARRRARRPRAIERRDPGLLQHVGRARRARATRRRRCLCARSRPWRVFTNPASSAVRSTLVLELRRARPRGRCAPARAGGAGATTASASCLSIAASRFLIESGVRLRPRSGRFCSSASR